MATIEIPKVRKESTIIMYVSLTDNGVTVDWTSLSEIKPFMYSDEQHCIAGKCTAEIVTGSPETLIVRYPTTAPQFLGQNSLLIRCTYDGNEKSFDVPVLEFVDRSSEATGVTVIEDPELPVAIEVQDVDTSVLDDAIAAALDAAAKATAAAELVPLDILAQCQAAAEAAEAAAENCAPVIGDNGNWWIYDYDAGEYVDSGKPSRGIQGEQGIQGIQGIQGNTGSSVDYPYELVNNRTTDDATKGLSAAEGKRLGDDLSQLDQKIFKFAIPVTATGKYIALGSGVGTHIGAVTNNASYNYMRYPVSPGDIVIVNGTGGNSPRLWAFIDSSEVILSVAASSMVETDCPLVAPKYAAEVIINTSDKTKTSYCIKSGSITEALNATDTQIESIDKIIGLKKTDGVETSTAISDKYVLYSTGADYSPAAYHFYKEYSIALANIPGASYIRAFVGFDIDTAAAIAFYTGVPSQTTYLKNVSVPSRMGTGWFDAVIPASAKYVVVSNRGLTNETPAIIVFSDGIPSDDELQVALTSSAKAKDVAGRGYAINIFANKPYYAHFYPNAFLKARNGDKVLASESLEDIRFCARLGFDFIEANIIKTADDNFITIHGTNGAFGTIVTSLDDSVISPDDIMTSCTLQNIKNYLRYATDIVKNRTTIPTLEEFCKCCKQNNIGILAGTGDKDAIDILIKYMGNNIILYNPPANVRDYFPGYVLSWQSDVSKTAAQLLAVADSYGPPFMLALNPDLIAALITNEQFDTLLTGIHERGCLLGTAYETEEQERAWRSLGMDFFASGHQVNPFTANFEVIGIEDVETTGTKQDGKIILAEGDTVTFGSDTLIEVGKGELTLRYSGEIDVYFGSTGTSVQRYGIASDGSNYVNWSDYFCANKTKVIITATEATEISDLSYITSKC